MDKHIVEAIKRSRNKKNQAALHQAKQPVQETELRHFFRAEEMEKERYRQHASPGG